MPAPSCQTSLPSSAHAAIWCRMSVDLLAHLRNGTLSVASMPVESSLRRLAARIEQSAASAHRRSCLAITPACISALGLDRRADAMGSLRYADTWRVCDCSTKSSSPHVHASTPTWLAKQRCSWSVDTVYPQPPPSIPCCRRRTLCSCLSEIRSPRFNLA